MSYRRGSDWSDKTELACLAIFKKLEEKDFPRGLQIDLCGVLSKKSKLSVGSISAKVCNYKSVAGVNSESNASHNTHSIYKQYGHLSSGEIEKVMNRMPT